MGIPQSRERVFFICIRKDISANISKEHTSIKEYPTLRLNFTGEEIPFKDVECGVIENSGFDFVGIEKGASPYYEACKHGEKLSTYHPKGHYFSHYKLHPNKVAPTIHSKNSFYHYSQKRRLTKKELCLIGSFPLDFDFMGVNPVYGIGMSVPPLMIAGIAREIYNQWISNI